MGISKESDFDMIGSSLPRCKSDFSEGLEIYKDVLPVTMISLSILKSCYRQTSSIQITMTKPLETSSHTTNESRDNAKRSIGDALDAVEEQTTEVGKDNVKDGDSKSGQTSDATTRARKARDGPKSIVKGVSSVGKSEPTQSKTISTLDGKFKEHGESHGNKSTSSDASGPKEDSLGNNMGRSEEQLVPQEDPSCRNKNDENFDSGEPKNSQEVLEESSHSAGRKSDGHNDTSTKDTGLGPQQDNNNDSQSIESSDSFGWGKKQITNMVKSWFGVTATDKSLKSKSGQESADEDSECATPEVQLIELPMIPSRYRAKEINGFGVLAKSQKLPKQIEREYRNLLNTGITCVLQFCKSLEILHEKSRKNDISKLFAVQFTKMHFELTFTEEDLKTKGDIDGELLRHLKILFNDLFSSNNIIWIVNKFEYDDFRRSFRKTIARVLREEFHYDVSYKREEFYRDVVAASLSQWGRNIPFP
ncbi:hypothetical protein KGF57_003283 [Candida theae]|uniref:Uncharacterized protein n=1 Tax=Candida theae TaxID=1198502 RepID=A0AAD5BDI5_9ASCO|nr:uncharacterized protein KGF57_003283 [Candida theae]KAI5957589.1 hypothetical protein KGF57_003283 [Candida theae]